MSDLTNNQQDVTAALIARYLAVEDVTYGDQKGITSPASGENCMILTARQPMRDCQPN